MSFRAASSKKVLVGHTILTIVTVEGRDIDDV